MTASCSETILKSLYTINKIAKQYSQNATEAYEHGFGADAKYKSVRKDALYNYKSYILKQLYEADEIDRITKHIINEREYYCFYINNYSFHSPIEDFDQDIPVSNTDNITEEYNSNPKFDELPVTEQEALQELDEQFSTSPNKFLPQTFLSGTYNPRFIGWDYLSDSVQLGDKTQDEAIQNSRFEQFLFGVGDKFETTEGTLEILEKYGIWSTGYDGFSDVATEKPAYTVELNGEVQENILQKRIEKDWKITLETTDNPNNIHTMSGTLWTDYLQPALEDTPELHTGDTLYFKEDSTFEGDIGTITRIEVSGSLLFCNIFFQNAEWDEYLAPDEFIDSVDRIEHENEPKELI